MPLRLAARRSPRATRTRSGASTSTSPPTTGCSGTPTSRRTQAAECRSSPPATWRSSSPRAVTTPSRTPTATTTRCASTRRRSSTPSAGRVASSTTRRRATEPRAEARCFGPRVGRRRCGGDGQASSSGPHPQVVRCPWPCRALEGVGAVVVGVRVSVGLRAPARQARILRPTASTPTNEMPAGDHRAAVLRRPCRHLPPCPRRRG